MRRIVLCLDGTWNSAFAEKKRRDGHTVLKPSNPLKLARAVKPFAADGTEQIVYYSIGVGSLSVYPGTANWLLHHVDRILGGAFGARFEANVEDAVHFLTLNYEPGDEVYVFGFSRGAGTARAVTRFLEWNGGVPQKCDAYYLPLLFREWLRVKGVGDNRTFLAAKTLKPFEPVTVKYLGVWDTVMALGSRLHATAGSTTAGKKRAFFAGDTPSACVVRARQALAVDERRFDFRPEVWRAALPGQQVEQRWFAGVHSNVGGGYDRDGLANIAFHWIIDGASQSQLELDADFTKFFKGFAGDTLYVSSTPFYKVLDKIRSMKGDGKRTVHGYNAVLSGSVVDRMNSSTLLDDERKAVKTPYRPENAIRFLAEQPDLTAYLQQIGAKQTTLPADVMQQIERLRAQAAAGATPASA
ncbi:MAG TPA: DUF2235 domain-containing protein [Thermoanaerobaculia bacterium]|nr:DUF2235 domain-containing protein [Thermoanaerobaculia bacterium]